LLPSAKDTGLAKETIHPPATVITLGQFVEWQRERGPAYDAVLAPDPTGECRAFGRGVDL
jgi:hypothetical protein